MLYIQATVYSVQAAAQDMGRYEQLGGWYGIKALVEYYENLSDETGKPIEVDITAWCGDWSHYEDEDELLKDHESLEDLRDETVVLELEDGGFLVAEQYV